MKKNFYNDLIAAQQSEQIVVNYLSGFGYYVEDVRHLKNYQVRSIDFVAIRDQQVLTVEVKDDTKGCHTQNFIIELESENGKPGWFKKCQATTLAIVSQPERTIFLLSMVQLKNYLNENENKLKHVTIRDYNTDGSYEAFDCVLVPRGVYESINQVIRLTY